MPPRKALESRSLRDPSERRPPHADTRKTFEELDEAEKDALLKTVAIRLGLIRHS